MGQNGAFCGRGAGGPLEAGAPTPIKVEFASEDKNVDRDITWKSLLSSL